MTMTFSVRVWRADDLGKGIGHRIGCFQTGCLHPVIPPPIHARPCLCFFPPMVEKSRRPALWAVGDSHNGIHPLQVFAFADDHDDIPGFEGFRRHGVKDHVTGHFFYGNNDDAVVLSELTVNEIFTDQI